MNEFPINLGRLPEQQPDFVPPLQENTKDESTHDFAIAKAEKGTPEYADAIPLNLEGNESDEEIKRLITSELPNYFWWHKPKWKEKGAPLEMVRLRLASGGEIELYNWLRPLSEQELGELKEVVDTYAAIGEGKATQTLGYILINDQESEGRLKTGEPMNGNGSLGVEGGRNGIELYPPAFEGGHRAALVSNFKGTLIHEGAHHLASQDVINEWTDTFEWDGPDPANLQVQEPDRCVTDYARTSPAEDICDSMAARLGGNPNLDTERGRFLDEKLLERRVANRMADTELALGEDVKLPRLPETIYYRNSPRITVGVQD
ncbi:MAG: hypothetical protein WCO52_04190 [bacterium]